MPSGTLRMGHAVDRFVDGSVAAQDQDQVGSVRDRLARHLRGIARGARSATAAARKTRAGQSFSGTV